MAWSYPSSARVSPDGQWSTGEQPDLPRRRGLAVHSVCRRADGSRPRGRSEGAERESDCKLPRWGTPRKPYCLILRKPALLRDPNNVLVECMQAVEHDLDANTHQDKRRQADDDADAIRPEQPG